MYYSQMISERIKFRLRVCGISVKKMLSDLDLSINTISELGKGKEISYVSFAHIAEYLNCSTDYLLGRTDQIDLNTGKSVDVDVNIGDNSANINIGYSPDDVALLNLINKMDLIDRSKLIFELSQKYYVK